MLWIWDNVEPVHGFPAGTKSAWSPDEIADLAGFLRDLRFTKAKVVLTSRRTEDELLGELPTRVRLPPMAMPERFQLARAVSERTGHRLTDVDDWRLLLRFTEGNPLTVTVLVREALRSGIRSRAEVEHFVGQIRAGGADLADEEDLGRSRSLGASLNYGLASAFSQQDYSVLALLHFFQRAVSSFAVKQMLASLQLDGMPDRVRVRAVRVTPDDVDRVLRTAVDIGLLTALTDDMYLVHPALPWYFQRLFTETFGPLDSPESEAVTRAYAEAVAWTGSFGEIYTSDPIKVVRYLALEEANLLYARNLGIRHRWWDLVMNHMRGLQTLYEHTGRDVELSRLCEELAALLTNWFTDLPEPDLESSFNALPVAAAIRGHKHGRCSTHSSSQDTTRSASSFRLARAYASTASRAQGTTLGRACYLLGLHREAEAHFERAVAMAKLPAPAVAVEALLDQATGNHLRDGIQSLALAHRAIELARGLMAALARAGPAGGGGCRVAAARIWAV